MIIKHSEVRGVESLLKRLERDNRRQRRIAAMSDELDVLRNKIHTLKATELERKTWLENKIWDLDNIKPSAQAIRFFAKHPHLVMPLGFDEFRIIPTETELEKPEEAFKLNPHLDLAYPHELLYRNRQSGAWYHLEGVSEYSDSSSSDNTSFHFVGPSGNSTLYSFSKFKETIERLCDSPTDSAHTLLLSGLWTPASQSQQRIILANVVPELLKGILQQRLSLRDIPWRQLEEIVAELLRASGMEVWVTPSSHDGGRDVIARGELIPGEPTLLAVEVKQKQTVGLADVQRALQANKNFPALLVATAGTFSGGVIREKSKPDNCLRLFIKDGVALGQWMEEYAFRLGWNSLVPTRRPSK